MLFPKSFQKVSVTLTAKSGRGSPPAKIFSLRHSPSVSGSRKVLLLLHGFPQNHTAYYETVKELSKAGILEHWDVVIPDLPGYGLSLKIPSVDGSHFEHSKRAIASDCVALIDALYGADQKFIVAGHDRGARVAYRMAKDFRDRILGPTNVAEALIGASSDFYFSQAIESWTGPRNRGHLDPIAVASWVEQYHNPAVLTGSLEDYRAGATIDLEHDEDDERLGKSSVDCPLLVLHSENFAKTHDVEGIWKALGTSSVNVKQVGDAEIGHFVFIEAAAEAVAELVPWMNGILE